VGLWIASVDAAEGRLDCFCESAPATHVGQAECGPVADAPFRRSASLDTVERDFLVGEQLNIACHLDCCGLDCQLEY
jgi:hypothetical protein